MKFPAASELAQSYKLWALLKVETVSADKLIAIGAGYIFGLYLDADDGVATANILDGTSAEGRIINTLSCPTNQTDNHEPHVPIPFVRGLYIDIGENVLYVTVLYLLARDLDLE